jgi:hypothetical protein
MLEHSVLRDAVSQKAGSHEMAKMKWAGGPGARAAGLGCGAVVAEVLSGAAIGVGAGPDGAGVGPDEK